MYNERCLYAKRGGAKQTRTRDNWPAEGHDIGIISGTKAATAAPLINGTAARLCDCRKGGNAVLFRPELGSIFGGRCAGSPFLRAAIEFAARSIRPQTWLMALWRRPLPLPTMMMMMMMMLILQSVGRWGARSAAGIHAADLCASKRQCHLSSRVCSLANLFSSRGACVRRLSGLFRAALTCELIIIRFEFAPAASSLGDRAFDRFICAPY